MRAAQAVTGEVLWLASHSRPDLAFACSIMSQFAVRRPESVIAIGQEVLKYVARNPGLGIYYGAETEVEKQGVSCPWREGERWLRSTAMRPLRRLQGSQSLERW